MTNEIYSPETERLLLILGGGEGAATVESGAALLDLRTHRLPLDEGAVEWLAISGPPACIAVEVGADADEGVLSVLREVEMMVRDRGVGAVVAFPRACLDMVVAAVTDARVMLLCEPTAAERLSALAVAANGRATEIHEQMTGENEAQRLQRLTEEVGRIARALAQLSQNEAAAEHAGRRASQVPPGPFVNEASVDAATVRGTIRLRRLRDQFFDSGLFADPAWDMLLDLFAAKIEGRQVAVSSLCIAAAVPPTTALRWIGSMTETGLILRRCDPHDRRRVFLLLSDEAAAGMSGYFQAVERTGLRIAA